MTPTPIPADAPEDLAPLIALYNSTNGPNWRNNENWLSDKPLYQWHGITTDTNGRVTQVILRSNRLEGTLPPELGELDQLRVLHLGNSDLYGTIPREIGRLTQLQRLILESNDLTGPIPHEIGFLRRLSHIDLAYNDLTGAMPPNLLSSTSLEYVRLSYNDLTGPIPSDIPEDSQIRDLFLDRNHLSSEIPDEIGRIRFLIRLFLDYNQLTGEIPNTIGQMVQLGVLTASNNRLTGSIPDGIANLRTLYRLELDNNWLTGNIPEALGENTALSQLGIIGNDFTGCIPSNLKDVETSNIDFAPIEVCGEPERTEPIIPPYINLEISNEAAPATRLAIGLATQWLNDFIEDIGWRHTPENKINVYAGSSDSIGFEYARRLSGCDWDCAKRIIRERGGSAAIGAAFVTLFSVYGNGPEAQAAFTARYVMNAMQLEAANQTSWRQEQSDPKWWTDGLATLVGRLVVADGTGRNADKFRQTIHDDANFEFKPLTELEDYPSTSDRRPDYRHYIGAAAVDFLATQVGLRKLTDFYTDRMPDETWQQAFQRIFNISVPDFYERFNQHHRAGFPLRELSLEGSTDWPAP